MNSIHLREQQFINKSVKSLLKTFQPGMKKTLLNSDIYIYISCAHISCIKRLYISSTYVCEKT